MAYFEDLTVTDSVNRVISSVDRVALRGSNSSSATKYEGLPWFDLRPGDAGHRQGWPRGGGGGGGDARVEDAAAGTSLPQLSARHNWQRAQDPAASVADAARMGLSKSTSSLHPAQATHPGIAPGHSTRGDSRVGASLVDPSGSARAPVAESRRPSAEALAGGGEDPARRRSSFRHIPMGAAPEVAAPEGHAAGAGAGMSRVGGAAQQPLPVTSSEAWGQDDEPHDDIAFAKAPAAPPAAGGSDKGVGPRAPTEAAAVESNDGPSRRSSQTAAPTASLPAASTRRQRIDRKFEIAVARSALRQHIRAVNELSDLGALHRCWPNIKEAFDQEHFDGRAEPSLTNAQLQHLMTTCGAGITEKEIGRSFKRLPSQWHDPTTRVTYSQFVAVYGSREKDGKVVDPAIQSAYAHPIGPGKLFTDDDGWEIPAFPADWLNWKKRVVKQPSSRIVAMREKQTVLAVKSGNAHTLHAQIRNLAALVVQSAVRGHQSRHNSAIFKAIKVQYSCRRRTPRSSRPPAGANAHPRCLRRTDRVLKLPPRLARLPSPLLRRRYRRWLRSCGTRARGCGWVPPDVANVQRSIIPKLLSSVAT